MKKPRERKGGLQLIVVSSMTTELSEKIRSLQNSPGTHPTYSTNDIPALFLILDFFSS